MEDAEWLQDDYCGSLQLPEVSCLPFRALANSELFKSLWYLTTSEILISQ